MVIVRDSFISQDVAHRMINKLGDEIKNRYPDHIILAIEEGGVEVAKLLDVAYEKFPKETGSGEYPKLRGEKVLILDDKIRSGSTIKRVYNVVKGLGSVDIGIAVLIMREGSSIVPNIYVIDTPSTEEYVLPWDNIPLRVYPFGVIQQMNQAEICQTYPSLTQIISSGGVMSYFREIDKTHHKFKGFVLDSSPPDAISCAVICYWEDDNEIFIEMFHNLIDSKNPNFDDYSSTLLEIILNCAQHHNKTHIASAVKKDDVKNWCDLGFTLVEQETTRTSSGEELVEVRLKAKGFRKTL